MSILKEEDFSPEELKRCKDDPLYFYNKYVKHEGKRDLTQEEYDAIVKDRQVAFTMKGRSSKIMFAYPKTPDECSGYRPSTEVFDEAGDPRLMSDHQKQEMVKSFNNAKTNETK